MQQEDREQRMVRGLKAKSLLRKQSPDICRQCHNNKFDLVNSKHDLSKLPAEETDMLKSRGAGAWDLRELPSGARSRERLLVDKGRLSHR